MESRTQNFLTEFGGDVGRHMGRLYTLCIMQTSALLALTTLMRNEMKLSVEAHATAGKALTAIDCLIGTLDEALGEIEKNRFDVERYLGAADE